MLQPREDLLRIGDKDFIKLTGYLKANFGIDLAKKRDLIESRLNSYIVNKGYADYPSYMSLLFADKTGQEFSDVINLLTTNYSYFMREWNSVQFFADSALPALKNRVKDKDLRVWSAGCSTGEEPYTMAILLDEFFQKEKALWDTKVLATDISEKALKKARAGEYGAAALKDMPAKWKQQYFEKGPVSVYRIKPSVKKEVIFRRFNLADDMFPFKKKFHVIFCRNVMIYFGPETKRALIDRFYQATEDGGYLIIGQSESIDRNASSYRYIRPSIFQKGE